MFLKKLEQVHGSQPSLRWRLIYNKVYTQGIIIAYLHLPFHGNIAPVVY